MRLEPARDQVDIRYLSTRSENSLHLHGGLSHQLVFPLGLDFKNRGKVAPKFLQDVAFRPLVLFFNGKGGEYKVKFIFCRAGFPLCGEGNTLQSEQLVGSSHIEIKPRDGIRLRAVIGNSGNAGISETLDFSASGFL